MKNRFAHGAIRTYSLCSPALIFMTAALSVTVIACLLWSAAVASLASQGTAFANSHARALLSEGRLHLFLSLFEILGGALVINFAVNERQQNR